MHILMTGGTGLIGTRIIEHRVQDSFIVVTRNRLLTESQASGARVSYVLADALSEFKPVQPVTVVLNLAGEPIADRPWTPARRQLLRKSRIELTSTLIASMAKWSAPPGLLISGSATGIYQAVSERDLTEQSAQSDDFAGKLCSDWEHAALEAQSMGVKVALLRIGLILDSRGGLLGKLHLPFSLGLGGRLGSGRQAMPWIHHRDLVRLVDFLIESDDPGGPWNASAPNPVDNAEFTRCYAAALGRPAFIGIPSVVLKLMGDVSSLLLEGQRMVPARALAAGFEFEFDSLNDALRDIVKGA